MRFDTPIYFQKIVKGEYDPDTGDYAEDTVIEAKKFANVTETGTKSLQLIYAQIKEGGLTARLQVPYPDTFDKIRIGDKVYKSDFSRWGKVFVLSEDI